MLSLRPPVPAKCRRFCGAGVQPVLARTPDDMEATILLGRCLRREGPTTADTKLAGRERLKQTFEETALRQLQAELKKWPARNNRSGYKPFRASSSARA